MSLTIDDTLRLERYKLVTSRQTFFTELGRSVFTFYCKAFVGVCVAVFTLLSTMKSLEIEPVIARYMLEGLIVALSLLGLSAALQIGFCLVRWYGYRSAERKIYKESPTIAWWSFVFEILYIIIIVISLILAWLTVTFILEHSVFQEALKAASPGG